MPHVQGYIPHREPYTEKTLVRAIREGVDQQGRRLSYLMPRYRLDKATMTSLVAYLKGLTSEPVPGVTNDTLHFATIIAPDADPVATKGMLDVLKQFFADKNDAVGGYRGATGAMQSGRGVMYRVNRKWLLHVWELSGPPASWEQQLQAKLAEQPVFAVVSGIAGKTWAPVHHFCEQQSIPCLLPNVELPVTAEDDFYPIYYSKGSLLESQLISRQLRIDHQRLGLRRVIQVFRRGDIGEASAQALAASATGTGLQTEARGLGAGDAKQELAAVLKDASASDAVVLWLRPGDVRALPASPPAAPAIFLSGLMGGLEDAPLPAEWRPATHLTYPFDLPDLRKVRMNFPLGWFKVRHVPVVATRVQTDTYLTCVILSETIGHMLDSFVRDYLVERVEALLSHRQINGYYPRLGLSTGQRFASKGGYLVHFAQPEGTGLVAEGEWIVP